MSVAPEFAIVGIFGPPRQGKTLLMTALGHDEKFVNGFKVFSNYHTTFSEYVQPTDFIHFDEKIQNGVLLIDEIYTIIDARNSAGVGNKTMSYFFFQCGKRGLKVYFTAQLLRTVDIRVQEILTEKIDCHKVVDAAGQPVRFEYHVENEFQSTDRIIERPLYEKIKKLYDTKEIIMPLSISSAESTDWETVTALYEECPNKQTFILEMQDLNPYLAEKNFGSCYDWLKAGKPERARKAVKL